MVEEACSAMVDPEMVGPEIVEPEFGTAVDVSGVELICATDKRAGKPAMRTSTNRLIENDLISCLKSHTQPNRNEGLRTENWELHLHLVLAKVIVAQVFQPLAEFLAIHGGHGIAGGLLRVLQHLVLNENRAIHAQRQRQRVRRTRVNADHVAFFFQPDDSVESLSLIHIYWSAGDFPEDSSQGSDSK